MFRVGGIRSRVDVFGYDGLEGFEDGLKQENVWLEDFGQEGFWSGVTKPSRITGVTSQSHVHFKEI